MLSEPIVVALLALIGNIIGSWLVNNKNNAILSQKLSYLEEKVNKHNNLIERMYKVESDIRTAFLKIDEINEKIEK